MAGMLACCPGGHGLGSASGQPKIFIDLGSQVNPVKTGYQELGPGKVKVGGMTLTTWPMKMRSVFKNIKNMAPGIKQGHLLTRLEGSA